MKTYKLYCIPGLGTDRRIFGSLIPLLEGVEPIYLDYLEPEPKEEVETYLNRLEKHFGPVEQPALIMGMSLGGMLAVKLAQRWEHELLILLSTVKKSEERPFMLNLAQKIPLHRLVTAGFTRWLMPRMSRFFGVRTAEGRKLYAQMLRDANPKHLKWGREAAIQFENEEVPQPYLHIHGNKDHIFTSQKVEATHIIDNATHYLVKENAEEVAAIINKSLTQLRKASA